MNYIVTEIGRSEQGVLYAINGEFWGTNDEIYHELREIMTDDDTVQWFYPPGNMTKKYKRNELT